MNEIIAALIIACSNLTHGESDYDARKKAECVQRVSKCASSILEHVSFDIEKTRDALKCAKEVHL